MKTKLKPTNSSKRRRRVHETLINSILSMAPVRSHGLIYSRSHARLIDVPFGVAAHVVGTVPSPGVSRLAGALDVGPWSLDLLPARASMNPTIQQSTYPIIQPPVGRGRSQSEPSAVLFVRRRAPIHSQVPRSPFAPVEHRSVATPVTLYASLITQLHSIAKIPTPVFSHPFASPRQGCASLGKATQTSKEKTSASLACKASFLDLMPTPQSFAQKQSAPLRIFARNSALSFIIAHYVGIPWHILTSREWTQWHSPFNHQHSTPCIGLSSELTQVNPGLAQIFLSYGANFLIQSDRIRPNLSQPVFRQSFRPNLTYGQVRLHPISACLPLFGSLPVRRNLMPSKRSAFPVVNLAVLRLSPFSVTSAVVAKWPSRFVEKYQETPRLQNHPSRDISRFVKVCRETIQSASAVAKNRDIKPSPLRTLDFASPFPGFKIFIAKQEQTLFNPPTNNNSSQP
jgi:hypothetical protein